MAYVSGLNLNPLSWFHSAPKQMATPQGLTAPNLSTTFLTAAERARATGTANIQTMLNVGPLMSTSFNKATGKILIKNPLPVTLTQRTTLQMQKPLGITALPMLTAPSAIQTITTTPTAAATSNAAPKTGVLPKGTTLNTVLAGGLAVAAALFMPRGSSGGSAPSAGSAYAPTTSQFANAGAPSVATPGTIAPQGGAYVQQADGSVAYVPAGSPITPGASYVPAEQYMAAASGAGGVSPWLIAAAIGGVALVAFVPKGKQTAAYRRTPAARTRRRRYA